MYTYVYTYIYTVTVTVTVTVTGTGTGTGTGTDKHVCMYIDAGNRRAGHTPVLPMLTALFRAVFRVDFREEEGERRRGG